MTKKTLTSSEAYTGEKEMKKSIKIENDENNVIKNFAERK